MTKEQQEKIENRIQIYLQAGDSWQMFIEDPMNEIISLNNVFVPSIQLLKKNKYIFDFDLSYNVSGTGESISGSGFAEEKNGIIISVSKTDR